MGPRRRRDMTCAGDDAIAGSERVAGCPGTAREHRAAARGVHEPVKRHGPSSALYGLMAEFDRDDVLVEAARKIHDAGYRRIDAFSPFPVHGLAEAMGRQRTLVPLVVLLGGLVAG